MEAHIIFQGKNDPPQLTRIRQPIVNLSENPTITFALIEGGMRSGDPSVMIISQDDEGSVILQTSLDKFLTSASGMFTTAKERWGWEWSEGQFSLMPMSNEARKQLLETIKKELEEWDSKSD